MPDSLADLVRQIDRVLSEELADRFPVLIGLTDDGFELVQPPPELDHPVSILDAFPVPDSWWAVAVMASGRARDLDDGPLGRVRITYAMSRAGEEVSFVRFVDGDGAPEPFGPMVGLIPDACRRALGLLGRR